MMGNFSKEIQDKNNRNRQNTYQKTDEWIDFFKMFSTFFLFVGFFLSDLVQDACWPAGLHCKDHFPINIFKETFPLQNAGIKSRAGSK